jgi:hypothetical protein
MEFPISKVEKGIFEKENSISKKEKGSLQPKRRKQPERYAKYRPKICWK